MDSKNLAIIIVLAIVVVVVVGLLLWKFVFNKDKKDKKGDKKEETSSGSADDFFSDCEKNLKDTVKTKWSKIDNDDKFKMFVAGMRTLTSIGKDNYMKVLDVTEDKKKTKTFEEIEKVTKGINELSKITNDDDKKKKIDEIKQLDTIAKIVTAEKSITEKKYDEEKFKAAIKEVLDANSSKKEFFEKKPEGKDYTVVQGVVGDLVELFKAEVEAGAK